MYISMSQVDVNIQHLLFSIHYNHHTTAPPPSIYPPFQKALGLAHQLGVRPSIETLKTLEVAEIKKATNPRLAKCPRVSLPHGKTLGLEAQITLSLASTEKGKDCTNRDEVVSLGGSEDVPMGDNTDYLFEEDAGKPEFDYNNGDDDHVIAFWQVSNPSQKEPETNPQTELNRFAICSIPPSSPNKTICSCSHECDCMIPEQEWLLDSGASQHYTSDLNDFVNYAPLEIKCSVQTANSSASIEGQGTIILVLSTGERVRIHPVYYAPGLNCKLLSLGTFLLKGFLTVGSKSSIRVLKGATPFLTFYPWSQTDSIYVIHSWAAKVAELYSASSNIYMLDYETIHRHLAHPSKDVLQKARKHLKDFPEIDFPKGDSPCPGCTQGKMTNRPFPVTPRRATQPFQLIHLDLKSFPVESYHRFQYMIIFLDNYSSHAWTVNLCTKDAALTTTSHFLALVENKFGARVKQWMSDAGGEYKSAAYTKLLSRTGSRRDPVSD
jgi:hypothetical protein